MTDEFDSDIQNQDDPYLLKIDLQNCRDQWHEHALKQGLEIARLRAEAEENKAVLDLCGNTERHLRDKAAGLFMEGEKKDGQIATLTAQLEQLYAPGEFECGKCGFVLTKLTMNMGSGTITTDNKNDTKCPNCDVIMWRVTWQSVAEKGMASIDELFEDNKNKSAQLDQAKELIRFPPSSLLDDRGWLERCNKFIRDTNNG